MKLFFTFAFLLLTAVVFAQSARPADSLLARCTQLETTYTKTQDPASMASCEACFRGLIADHPQEMRAYYGLVHLYMQSSNCESALDAVRKGVENNPEDFDLLWMKASFLNALRRPVPEEDYSLLTRLAKADYEKGSVTRYNDLCALYGLDKGEKNGLLFIEAQRLTPEHTEAVKSYMLASIAGRSPVIPCKQ